MRGSLRVATPVQELLAHELQLQDEVFLSADQRQVFGGDVWLDKIRAALQECEVLVLMLSKRALGRSWVNFEAGGIWLIGRPVIPVCFGNVSKHNLVPPYASMQALDLPKDAGYLIDSVYHHLRVKPPPPPSPHLMGLILAGPGERDPAIQERMNSMNESRMRSGVSRTRTDRWSWSYATVSSDFCSPFSGRQMSIFARPIRSADWPVTSPKVALCERPA